MKKKLQFLFAMTLMWCVGLTASAQRALDVLANPSFELSAAETPLTGEYKVSSGAPTIYGWTLATVGTQFNNTEILTGNNGSSSQFGTSTPSEGEYSLFFRQGWNGAGNVFTLTSDPIATELAAGTYTIAVDYKQHYSFDEDSQANNNTTVGIALLDAEDNVIATATSPAAAGSKGSGTNDYFNGAEWSTLSPAAFDIDEPLAAGAKIVITLNSFGARRSDFFIDNVVVTFKMNNAQIEAAYENWRAANLQITEMDKKYDPAGQIDNVTDDPENKGVRDLMNEADKKLTEAVAKAAEGEDFTDDLTAAADLVEEALRMAAENEATAKALPGGEYIIKTTVEGETYFLGANNNWGSHASLVPNSVAWKLAKVENGVYTFESWLSNGVQGGKDRHFLNGVWCDGGEANVYLTEVEEGVYVISSSAEANYFRKGEVGNAKTPLIENDGTLANALKWTIVSTAVENIQKGDNVTYLIKNADFGRNNRYAKNFVDGSSWKQGHVANANLDPSWTFEAENKDNAGLNENFCVESYGTVFTFSQTLENVPNGYYTFTAHGFYRNDWDENVAPVFFINENETPFPVLTGTENNMNQASQSFIDGLYKVSIPVKVTDGKITLGAKGTKAGKWNIWDNFGLVFKGDDATEYDAFMNEIPYAEMMDALTELVAKQTLGKEAVEAYAEQYVKDAVKADVKAVDDAIGVPSDTEADPAVAATGLYKTIEDAYKAGNAAGVKDEVLAQIGVAGDAEADPAVPATGLFKAIEDYLDKAKGLKEGNESANEDMTTAYEALVAQWQDAYDKINTQYKEYINDDNTVYNGYLKSLNSIQVDVEALEETIAGYFAAGTSAENKEKTLETINKLSEDIAKVLSTALNTYNDEVATANQKAYNDLMEAADAMIERYKEAIKVVSAHYAKYHPEAASDAQVALFYLYEQVRAVKSDATDDYAATEAGNAEKFKNEEFPLVEFDPSDYNADLDIINIDNIDEILADLEDAAQDDVYAKLAELAVVAADLEDRAGDIFAKVLELGLEEKYGERRTALEQMVAELVEAAKTYMDHFEEPSEDAEIPQDQGKTLDDFTRADLVVGEEYNTYTANSDLTVAFKMFDIDVKGYDYVVVKFAEPVPAGWNIAFGAHNDQGSTAIPEGATAFTHILADNPAVQNDILPQVTVLTLWGAQKPLTMKVKGIYLVRKGAHSGKYNCLIEALETTYNEKLEAVEDEIEALEELIAVDASADWLAKIEDAAQDAQDLIDEKKDDLEDYAEDIQTEYGPKYDKVAEELAEIVAAAIAADEAGELDEDAYDEFMALIGKVTDKPIFGTVDDGPLTKDMFHEWANGEIVGDGGCSYDIDVESEAPYGNGNVVPSQYADLGAYKTLIMTIKSGGVRLFFNVYEDEGGKHQDMMLNAASTDYVSIETDEETGDQTWTIDLEKYLADTQGTDLNKDGTLYLNAIKAAAWGQKATVSSMELLSAGLTNKTIYQKIYAISIPAENEAAYDEFTENIAEYKARLEELNNTIEEFEYEDVLTEDPAVIAGSIATLEATVEEFYADGELSLKRDQVDIFAEEMVEEPLAEDFDDIFSDALADQLDALKAEWNQTYASQPEDALFPGSDITVGEVWDMIVELENEVLAGYYDEREEYEEAKEAIETFNIIFTDYDEWIAASTLKGDGNLDGEITLADIIIAAQNALAEEEDIEGMKKRQFYASDANGDGVIDQSDIAATVDAFLTEDEADEAKARAAEIAANDYLVVDGKDVALENTTTFVAFTLEAAAADGSEVKVAKSDRVKGLTVMTKLMKNGNTRIVAYSMTNKPIDDTTGIILSADADINVSYANFTDNVFQSHLLNILSADEATGIANIEAGQSVDGDIYTVGGAKVNTLQKGINVIKTANGVKKVYVK